MQITGGKVSFTRGVKPADYEKKEATVELSFNVGDDDGDATTMLNHAAALAKGKALEMVGLKTEVMKAVEKIVALGDPLKVDPTLKEKRTRGPNKPKEPTEPVEELNISKTPEDRKPPAEPDPDGLDTLELTEEVVKDVTVTDKDLTDAVARFVAKTHNPAAVKKLRDEYVQPPKGIRDIAAIDRSSFLAKLDALATDPKTTVKEAA